MDVEDAVEASKHKQDKQQQQQQALLVVLAGGGLQIGRMQGPQGVASSGREDGAANDGIIWLHWPIG